MTQRQEGAYQGDGHMTGGRVVHRRREAEFKTVFRAWARWCKHIFNPSTCGGRGQPGLHGELQISQGYILRHCQRRKKPLPCLLVELKGDHFIWKKKWCYCGVLFHNPLRFSTATQNRLLCELWVSGQPGIQEDPLTTKQTPWSSKETKKTKQNKQKNSNPKRTVGDLAQW